MYTKYNLKKYRYILSGQIEVPTTWESIILAMVKEIDKTIRRKYVPLFVLNALHDISKYTIIGRYYLNMYTGGFYIDNIKQKFATLRISGNIELCEDIVNRTITTCNNMCEFCGNVGTDKVMIKSWVRNICMECQTKHKNNGVNI